MQRLQQLFDSDLVLDRDDLVIPDSGSCFRIRLSVGVLDADGSIFDASLLSCVAVMRKMELPVVEIHEDGCAEIAADMGEGKPVTLNCMPVAVTIGCFDNLLVVDPTEEEEPFMDATITVILNEHGDILSRPRFPSIVIAA